jgi:hypothetical protein
METTPKKKAEETDKIVQLHTITGGKGPPGGPHPDYLSSLPVHTIFTVRLRKSPNPLSKVFLTEYQVVFKDSCGIKLLNRSLTEQEQEEGYAWVAPWDFCQMFELIGILTVLNISRNSENEEEQQ